MVPMILLYWVFPVYANFWVIAIYFQIRPFQSRMETVGCYAFSKKTMIE